MRNLTRYFFDDYNLQGHSRVFKQALYMLVMIKCLYWLWHYDLLFGGKSVIYRAEGHTNFIKDLAYILYNNKSEMLALYFIAALAATCSFMILRPRNSHTADVAVWLLVVNLHYSSYATLTGGDYLLNQFLFFSIFIASDFNAQRGQYRDLHVCLHNAAIAAVFAQMCVVYLASGLAKVTDPSWFGGNAVAAVNRIRHFSAGGEAMPLFDRMATYAVMTYQLLFPLLIWIRPVRVPLLIAGVIMHLYIAIVPGIITFSAVMLAGYIYFWPEKNKAVRI